MKFFILVLLFTSTLAQAQNSPEMTAINHNIAKEYPFFRHVGATYSTLFGAMAIWQGGIILNKEKPESDNFLATATVLVGSLRFIDGSVALFSPGKAERMAKNNEIKDRAMLQKLANDAYKIRFIRSGLIAANSALFLALYAKGDEDYKMLIYPGVIMGLVATLNLIRPTPEERVFDLMPVKNGGALVFNYYF